MMCEIFNVKKTLMASEQGVLQKLNESALKDIGADADHQFTACKKQYHAQAKAPLKESMNALEAICLGDANGKNWRDCLPKDGTLSFNALEKLTEENLR